MKLKITLITLFLALTLLAQTVHATSTIGIDIILNKNIFTLNDTVKPVISISNHMNQQEVVFVYEQIINLDNKTVAYTEMNPTTIVLLPNSIANVSELYFLVTTSTANGLYEVKADVSQNGLLLNSSNKTFQIQNIPAMLDISIDVCKDENCKSRSMTFIKDENIYLNYESSISNPSVFGTLTLPDKTTQQITLPTNILGIQLGTYTVKVTASKEGYNPIEKTIQFGVIEKEAEIKTIETFGREISISDYILIIAFIIVFLLAIVLFKFR